MSDVATRLAAALEGRYAVGEQVGRGGMATVYTARDLKHGRNVAIKVLRPDLAAVIGAERFLREIQIAARLRHPHIVPLFDSGGIPAEPGAPPLLYYIMPLIEGESLRDRLKREGRLSVADATQIVREAGGALHYAHAHGVVHRDIKPENILLESGHALVADFGIARAVGSAVIEQAGSGTQLTETGSAIGTPAYMSPEQIEGRPAIDARSDVYSLACVLYELLAGRPPYAGPSAAAVAARHFIDPVPQISKDRPEVPAAVERVLSQALAKSPDERFGSAGEFVDALSGAVSGEVGISGSPARQRNRVGWLALAALVLLAAATTSWYVVGHRKGKTAAHGTANTTVAVLPFSVQGGPNFSYLGEGMVNLLSTKLDGAGDIRVVDPRAMLSHVQGASQSPMTLERGKTIADRFGAGLFVMGDVIEAGGNLQFNATLYRSNADTIGKAEAQGSAASLFALVDTVAATLLAEWSGKQSRLAGIAAVTTASLPALRAYLEGDHAMRNGDFDAALQSFRQACAIDSTFALAWYRMSVAAEWLTRVDLGREAADRALHFSTHLAEHDRLLLQALDASRHGQLAQARQLYQTITGSYPDDVEAWIQMAELLFHGGPLQGYSSDDSRPEWERVLSFEPTNLAALIHLSRIAASEHKDTELDSLVHRVIALRAESGTPTPNAREEVLEMQALRAFTLHDSTGMRQALTSLERASDLTVTLTGLFIATFPGEIAGGEEIIGLLKQPARAPPIRSVGFAMQAHLALARGQRHRANQLLDTLATFDPATAAEYRALFAAAPFFSLSTDQGNQLRFALEKARPLPPGTNQEVSIQFTAHDNIHPILRDYLIGILAARTGQSEAALRQAAALEGVKLEGEYGKAVNGLTLGIRAENDLKRGANRSALDLLERVPRDVGYQYAIASPFLGATRERFLLAEALRREGRRNEALRWYNSFSRGTYDLIYLAPSHLARGQMLEEMKRPADAAAEYRAFIALWKDADAELQPMVTEARGRLRALGGKR